MAVAVAVAAAVELVKTVLATARPPPRGKSIKELLLKYNSSSAGKCGSNMTCMEKTTNNGVQEEEEEEEEQAEQDETDSEDTPSRRVIEALSRAYADEELEAERIGED